MCRSVPAAYRCPYQPCVAHWRSRAREGNVLRYSSAVVIAAATLLIAGGAQARSGFIRTADGKCHYCNTNSTPMCTELSNDKLCKQYGSKSFAKISPTSPFGDTPVGAEPNVSAAEIRAATPRGSLSTDMPSSVGTAPVTPVAPSPPQPTEVVKTRTKSNNSND